MDISVVIPAYNRAHCISASIDSVITQTYQPHEIIIIDDGSTDNLQAVIDLYSGHSLKLVRHQKNQGASQARNTGIKHADADYIAFLDSDDTWHANKLEMQVAFMTQHNLEACCTNFAVYLNGVLEQERAYRPYNAVRLTEKDMAWGCYISPGTTFICKKDLLSSLGGYDVSFPRFEDWDLLLRLSQQADIGWLDRSLSNIYIEQHAAEQAESEGLNRMHDKYVNLKTSKAIKKIIVSSIDFHRAAIDFKRKRYVSFCLLIIFSFIRKPFNNFPIKAIFIPKIISKK